MRVVFFTCTGKAGSNVSLYHTLEQLKKRGVDIYIISPNSNTANWFNSLDVPTYCVSYFPCIWPQLDTFKDLWFFLPRLLLHQFTNIKAFISLKRIVSAIQPEIIHSNISLYDIGFRIAKHLDIPHVWHLREYITKDFNYHPQPSFPRYCLKLQSSYTISISKDLINHFGLYNEFRLIYNGILKREEQRSSVIKDNYILYVGALTEGKGVADLIISYLDFVDKNQCDLELRIAGNGTDEFKAVLHRIIKSSKLEAEKRKNIVFLGQRSDVSDLMSRAKCLVVPSISEAFGRITAEAMFNRCLVIGKNCAGTKEQFDNGLKETGREIGLRYSNEKELQDHLMRVVRGDDFSQMIEDAYYTVNHLYTPDVNAQNIYDYYKYIIERSNG